MNFIKRLFSKKARSKQCDIHGVVRCFLSDDEFIKIYLNKNGGSKQLKDKTWAVNQSDEFHKWCYDEGYKIWKSNNA